MQVTGLPNKQSHSWAPKDKKNNIPKVSCWKNSVAATVIIDTLPNQNSGIVMNVK